jgi:hypothetical protein
MNARSSGLSQLVAINMGREQKSLSCSGQGGEFLPGIDSESPFLSVSRGGQPMPARAEVVRNGTMGRKERLGMARRLEPLQVALPSVGRLMGITSSWSCPI